MTHRLSARRSRARLDLLVHRAILLLHSRDALTLASAGCFHFGAKPISANPPTQQQLEAYADTADCPSKRREPSQRRYCSEHCDQLAAATPGVEELRINQGAVESRQWTLLGNGSDAPLGFREGSGCLCRRLGAQAWPRQARLPTAPRACSRAGIQPLPRLRSSPEPRASRRARNPTRSERCSARRKGEFTWRGRKYSYTLTPELPCFPQLQ